MNARPRTTSTKPATSACAFAEKTPPIAAAPAPRSDEDDGEAGDERNAGDDDAPRRAALAEPSRIDARDRREVAGDERQHARREEETNPAANETASRVPITRSGASASSRRPRASGSSPSRRRPAAARRRRGRGSSARRRARAAPRRRGCRRSAATTRAGRSPCAAARRGPGAEVRHELRLDLALRPALRDPLRDQRFDLLRHRRVRLVERRVARRAHDLALEVRERRARRAGGSRRRRDRERRDERGDRAEDHELSAACTPCANCSANFDSVIGPEMWKPTSRPCRSTKYVSGNAGDPVAVADHSRAVLDGRVRDVVMLEEAARVAGHVVVVDAEEHDALRGGSACTRSRARAPPTCTARTTTPRSSARRASRAATRGRRCRCRRRASARTPAPRAPIFGGCDSCVSRQTSSASSPATAASAIAWPLSFRPRVMTGG